MGVRVSSYYYISITYGHDLLSNCNPYLLTKTYVISIIVPFVRNLDCIK